MAKNILGQYFTPSYIARIMVDLIESPRDSKILEPSAGEGVFWMCFTKQDIQILKELKSILR